MNHILSPEDLARFRKMWRGDWEDALDAAIKNADAFADQHAHDMLPSIKETVAHLHVRHAIEPDPGERGLIRESVDCLLALGRAVRNAQPDA